MCPAPEIDLRLDRIRAAQRVGIVAVRGAFRPPSQSEAGTPTCSLKQLDGTRPLGSSKFGAVPFGALRCRSWPEWVL